MFPPFVPVLAISIGGVVTLVVFSISVISWLVNLFQGNNPNAQGKPGNRPRPNNPGQSELERFLQEVAGGGKKPEPKKERPAPKQKQPNEKKQKQKPQPQAQRPATNERPGSRLAQSHLATSSLGDGVRSHVSSNIDAAVKRDVDAAVRRDIDAAVQRDIGSDGTTIPQHAAANVHPLISALRNPQGVRQAILMMEILNRPKSLR